MKKISLRTPNGWSYGFENGSKTNCDLCGAKLWIAPHGGIYCDAVHHLEDPEDTRYPDARKECKWCGEAMRATIRGHHHTENGVDVTS